MNTILLDGVCLVVHCETGKVSDGYHTFDELYDHRCLLFCMVLSFVASEAYMGFDLECWKSKLHDDGSNMDGWFIAGMKGACLEPVTYHLPEKMWSLLFDVPTLERAPKWDGHTSQDVLNRITSWLSIGMAESKEES